MNRIQFGFIIRTALPRDCIRIIEDLAQCVREHATIHEVARAHEGREIHRVHFRTLGGG